MMPEWISEPARPVRVIAVANPKGPKLPLAVSSEHRHSDTSALTDIGTSGGRNDDSSEVSDAGSADVSGDTGPGIRPSEMPALREHGAANCAPFAGPVAGVGAGRGRGGAW